MSTASSVLPDSAHILEFQIQTGDECEECGASRAIGVEIQEALEERYPSHFSNPGQVSLTFGDKLRIHIPDSLKLPIDAIRTDVIAILKAQEISPQEADEEEKSKKKWRQQQIWAIAKGVIGLATGIFFILICIFMSSLPAAAFYTLLALGLLGAVLLAIPTFKKTVQELKNRQPGMNLLYSLSILTALLASLLSPFVTGLTLMLDAAYMVLGMQSLGQVIERRAKQIAYNKAKPETPSHVYETTEGQHIHRDFIQNGAQLKLLKGSLVPFECECLSDGTINATGVTGQGQLKSVKKGETLLPGTLCETAVDVKVTNINKDARHFDGYLNASEQAKYDQIENLISAENKRYSRAFLGVILSVLSLAIIVGVIVGCLFPPALAIQCVVTLLVAACPCVLGFIRPLSKQLAMKSVEPLGIQFSDHAPFEKIQHLLQHSENTSVLFDLNGTLTTHQPDMQNLTLSADLDEETFWQCLHLLESQSQHPIAKCLVELAERKKTATSSFDPARIKRVDCSQDRGVSMRYQDGEEEVDYQIGDLSYFEKQGITFSNSSVDTPGLIILTKNQKPIAHFNLLDKLRPDAKSLIAAFQNRFGKDKVALMTGASKSTANYYAKLLDISEVHSEQSPDEKYKFVMNQQDMKKQNVIFVGDSRNDAPAARRAFFSVGVASEKSSPLVTEHADVCIRPDAKGGILSLLTAFHLPEKTRRVTIGNLAFSFTYNFAIIAVSLGLMIGLSFMLNPAIPLALLALETLIIVGMVLLSMRKPTQMTELPASTKTVCAQCHTPAMTRIETSDHCHHHHHHASIHIDSNAYDASLSTKTSPRT